VLKKRNGVRGGSAILLGTSTQLGLRCSETPSDKDILNSSENLDFRVGKKNWSMDKRLCPYCRRGEKHQPGIGC
jgi:hypothetical protein